MKKNIIIKDLHNLFIIKIAFLFCLVIFFISCSGDNSKFSIKGTFKNAQPGEEVKLYEMTTTELVPVDSSAIDKKGAFKLGGSIKYPGFYYLEINGSELFLIIGNGDKIKIEGNTENLIDTYSVQGNEDSKLLADYNKRLNFARNEKKEIARIANDSIESPRRDQIKEELVSRYNRMLSDIREYSRTFIEKNYNSLASLFVLYQQLGPTEPILKPKEDLFYFNKVDSALSANYPELAAVQELNKQVLKIKEQQKQEEAFKKHLGIGQPAPGIALPNTKGDTITLSSLEGKYVLLLFWASWSKKSIEDIKELKESYKSFRYRGFEVYSVSFDKDRESWEKAIEEQDLPWICVSDLKFWNSPVVNIYHIYHIPTNFLLDREGRILAKDIQNETLKERLKQELK